MIMAADDSEVFYNRFSDEEVEEVFDVSLGEEVDPDKCKKIKERQDEARKEGLIEFAFWKEKFTCKMTEIGVSDESSIAQSFQAVEEAARATCLVLRKDGGGGTGCLLKFCSLKGYLVITNNHVIGNENQANTSKVIFDYNEKDFSFGGTRQFAVKKILARSLKTSSSGDTTNLDYSVLTLNIEGKDEKERDEEENFLKDHAIVLMEESSRVQATGNKNIAKYWPYPKRPLIMFSHARGLAKRMSFGAFPDIMDYPVSHIRHELPSLKGSSGSNLLFSPIDDKSLKNWVAGFLHYRHGMAISWQAIGPHFRDMAKEKWGN